MASQEQLDRVYTTNNCGDLIITKYVGCREVHVKFINTNYETVVEMVQIKRGTVRDRSLPSVLGVGILGDAVTKVNGIHEKEHILWISMLHRCYDDKVKNIFPAYKGCSVSDNFKHFTYFKEWCGKQVGFGNKSWELDKDILVKGNKVYSEDTCCFVPKEINNILVKSKSSKKHLPNGISFKKEIGRYRTYRQTSVGSQKHLGYFDTKEDALYAYKQAKEAYIKQAAEKWKDQIDPRVYNALINYVVEIDE